MKLELCLLTNPVQNKLLYSRERRLGVVFKLFDLGVGLSFVVDDFALGLEFLERTFFFFGAGQSLESDSQHSEQLQELVESHNELSEEDSSHGQHFLGFPILIRY